MSDAEFRRRFDAARDPRTASNALQLQPGLHVMPLDANGNTALDGYIEMVEISNPSSPATNGARLYIRDNGAGKTQLVVLFPSGTAQVVVTEP